MSDEHPCPLLCGVSPSPPPPSHRLYLKQNEKSARMKVFCAAMQLKGIECYLCQLSLFASMIIFLIENVHLLSLFLIFFYKSFFQLVSFLFRYTRQVIDETLRAAVVAPWGARVYEYDLQVDKFVIPKEVCSVFCPGTLFKLVKRTTD